MTTAPPTPITIDEYMRLAAQHYRVELVNGYLLIQDVEMHPVGGTHVFVSANLYDLVRPYVKQRGLGLFVGDGLAYLLDEEDGVLRGSRVPDLSFVRQSDIARDWDMDHPYPGHPTLAIEVISPGESAQDILDKVADFLNAGTEQVWIVYPNRRELHQYFSDGRVRRYQGADVVDTSALFPGLTLNLSDLFVLPDLGG